MMEQRYDLSSPSLRLCPSRSVCLSFDLESTILLPVGHVVPVRLYAEDEVDQVEGMVEFLRLKSVRVIWISNGCPEVGIYKRKQESKIREKNDNGQENKA